jgi:hypothetical protein
MMIVSGYHILAAAYKVLSCAPLTMLPVIRMLNTWSRIFYISWYSKSPHITVVITMLKRYLAVVWGTVIMGITGFMMWNPLNHSSAARRIYPCCKGSPWS